MEINGKKVRIKHFLNTKLKAKKEYLPELRYPVYTQIGFDRKNTHLLTFENRGKGYTEKEFEDFFVKNHSNFKQKIFDLEKNIYKVLELCLENNSNSFSFKGFSRIYNIYTSNIINVVEDNLAKSIFSHLQTILTFKEFVELYFDDWRYSIPAQEEILKEPFQNDIILPNNIGNLLLMKGLDKTVDLINDFPEELKYRVKSYLHLYHFYLNRATKNQHRPYYDFFTWTKTIKSEFRKFLIQKTSLSDVEYKGFDEPSDDDYLLSYELKDLILGLKLDDKEVDKYTRIIEQITKG